MSRERFNWRMNKSCFGESKLSAYLDGELSAAARVEVEGHLGACNVCRARYEEMRFASRAMLHFIVPEAHAAVWRTDREVERGRASVFASLQRFCRMKIAVPAPVAAVIILTIISAVAFLFNRPVWTRPQGGNLGEVSRSETRLVEVPVEREVVRERVVTRIIRERKELRPFSQARAATDARQRTRASAVTRNAANDDEEISVRASLAGFRPVADANLRVVEEPER